MNLEPLENFLREAYKGRKYRNKDAYDYHLVGVAELAREKAREANLDPELAYAMGLCHDFIEDTPYDVRKLFALGLIVFAPTGSGEGVDKASLLADTVEALTNDGKTYYDYIKGLGNGIPDPSYVLLVKEADLEFNLMQDNAPKLRKYDLYRFALDTIRMKRILGR